MFGVPCNSRLNLRGTTTVKRRTVWQRGGCEAGDSFRRESGGVAGGEGWLLRQSYLAEALFWLAYYVGRRQLSIAGKPHET